MSLFRHRLGTDGGALEKLWFLQGSFSYGSDIYFGVNMLSFSRDLVL